MTKEPSTRSICSLSECGKSEVLWVGFITSEHLIFQKETEDKLLIEKQKKLDPERKIFHQWAIMHQSGRIEGLPRLMKDALNSEHWDKMWTQTLHESKRTELRLMSKKSIAIFEIGPDAQPIKAYKFQLD